VPFGAFGGLGARGFALAAAHFTPAARRLVDQLGAAGRWSYSPVQVAPVETVFCAPTTASACGGSSALRTLRYDITVAALDTRDERRVNYDALAFFDALAGIPPGPFDLPSTGPAYVKENGPSGKFFFEGSGHKVGAAFFVSRKWAPLPPTVEGRRRRSRRPRLPGAALLPPKARGREHERSQLDAGLPIPRTGGRRLTGSDQGPAESY
jgi:hypothetical protein